MTGYQTAQYVAGPTRNNVPQQQAKAVVAPAPYNANQAYPAQQTYQQNPQANAQPKREQDLQFKYCHELCNASKLIDLYPFYRTSRNNNF